MKEKERNVEFAKMKIIEKKNSFLEEKSLFSARKTFAQTESNESRAPINREK